MASSLADESAFGRAGWRRLARALAAGLLLAMGTAANAQPCHRPADGLDEGWVIAPSPESAAFDPAALCGALDAVAAGADNIHGVVVTRHGQLVAELYRDGPDRQIDVRYGLPNPLAGDAHFDATTRHDIRSISKSVVSLLVGIAIGQGALPGVSAPLLGFYPERADLLVDAPPQRARITLAHLLSMSSGLRWDEGALPNDETRLFWTADLPAYVLGRPFDSEPGERFLYNSGGTALLADVLVRSQGKSLSALAREQLFEPMGIRDWVWATDMRGRELAFTGLRMRPRDLAKLGQLVLDGGRWQGRQLVPAAWIAEATRPHLATSVRLPGDTARSFGYGYQWWTGSVPSQGQPLPWSAGFGNGGQRLYTVPALGLVVAISAGGYGSAAINASVHALFERIVAAAQLVPVRTPGPQGAAPPR